MFGPNNKNLGLIEVQINSSYGQLGNSYIEHELPDNVRTIVNVITTHNLITHVRVDKSLQHGNEHASHYMYTDH